MTSNGYHLVPALTIPASAQSVTIGADGLELSVRLDRQGARLHTVSL